MGEGTITIEGFRPFCQINTVLMLPLLAVQSKLRTTAMGTDFWEKMSNRTLELKKGKFVTLRELLVQVMQAIVEAIICIPVYHFLCAYLLLYICTHSKLFLCVFFRAAGRPRIVLPLVVRPHEPPRAASAHAGAAGEG